MVRDQGVLRLENPWPLIGWASFAAIVISSFLIGFVFLSRYQENTDPLTFWGAICRGLGITADTAAASSPQAPLRTPTEIAWTQTTLEQIRNGDAQHGSFIAMNCVACHEESTANPSHLVPILDGLDAAVIFKQLSDYRSGKRSWGVMNGIGKALDAQASADVAAYFATRTGRLQTDSGMRFPEGGRGFRQSNVGERLIFAGDPQRGIAPCASCHGPGGYKLGAPPLKGQYSAYIERQLAAFAQGIRQNDIYEQMRAIARRLTADEMKAVAEYFGAPGRQVAAKN
jgi:cytochrome c553